MSRRADRIAPTLRRLEEVWEQLPDVRLTQLICNAAALSLGHPPTEAELFNMEEKQLLAGLDELDARFRR